MPTLVSALRDCVGTRPDDPIDFLVSSYTISLSLHTSHAVHGLNFYSLSKNSTQSWLVVAVWEPKSRFTTPGRNPCSHCDSFITRLPKVIWEWAASPVVQPYLPCGANVHAHLIHDSLGPAMHSPSQTGYSRSIGFPFLQGWCRILSTLHCSAHFPQILILLVGFWTPILWFVGPTQPTTQNAISIESAVFQNSRSLPTDRQTDRPDQPTERARNSVYESGPFTVLSVHVLLDMSSFIVIGSGI